MTPYDRLKALGLTLPPPPASGGNYVQTLQRGPLLYVAGQGPFGSDGQLRTGKVGRDRTIEQAYDDARLTGLCVLTQVHAATGDLGRVAQVVRVFGMVNATEDFQKHPLVINGCSDLFIEVFGDKGLHPRSAVGMASLPFGISVEVETVFEIAD